MSEAEVLQNTASWQEMFIMSLAGAFLVLTAGMAAGKTGRAPFWGLLMLLPGLQIIFIWVLAFVSWPRIQEKDAKQKQD